MIARRTIFRPGRPRLVAVRLRRSPPAVVLALALGAGAAIAQRPEMPPTPPSTWSPARPPAPAPAGGPAAPAAETGPAESNELRALRAGCDAQTARLADARKRSVQGTLREAIAKADAELQDRTRVRNVRGMMIARSLKEALEAVLATHETEQRLSWPESVRRENEEDLAAARTAAETAETAATAAEAEFREQALQRFLPLLKPEDRPSEPEAARALFERWIARDWPPAAPAPGTPTPATPPDGEPAPVTPVTPSVPVAPPVPPPPDVFARSEPAEPAEGWFVVGRWTAEMAGPELFRVPVYEQSANGQGSQFNPLSQRSSAWNYEHVQALPAEGRHSFRLKRLAERETVDVVTWPRAGDRGPLMVRSRAGMAFPVLVGFELQASAAAPGAAPGETPAAPEAPAGPTVEIKVTSEPPGAAIIVGDRVYREGSTILRTPCTIRLAPSAHAVRLRLPGHVDHVVPEFRADHLRSLHGRLTAERDMPGKRVRINPRQVWEPAGEIRVNPGDRLVVVASGQWTIGVKGEECGPDGYDRKDPAFKHYYEGAGAPERPIREANYGALLVRIGFPGVTQAAGAEFSVTARQSGLVYLDVNEANTGELRKDNRGPLDVKVIVIPRDPPGGRGR